MMSTASGLVVRNCGGVRVPSIPKRVFVTDLCITASFASPGVDTARLAYASGYDYVELNPY